MSAHIVKLKHSDVVHERIGSIAGSGVQERIAPALQLVARQTSQDLERR